MSILIKKILNKVSRKKDRNDPSCPSKQHVQKIAPAKLCVQGFHSDALRATEQAGERCFGWFIKN